MIMRQLQTTRESVDIARKKTEPKNAVVKACLKMIHYVDHFTITLNKLNKCMYPSNPLL